MRKIVLDAGTTWAKIAEHKSSSLMNNYREYFVKSENDYDYYILPSRELKNSDIMFDAATGHMSLNRLNNPNNYENEIIALVKGFGKKNDKDTVILDMGSRDSKRVIFKNGKFKDLDWNNSCSSSTGATIEMLLKFYNLSVNDLKYTGDKYVITCGIFGLERIMDDIAGGLEPAVAVSKFVHGIAYNAWVFAKKTDKLYLSGGFCENPCFVESLKSYCDTVCAGRFLLCDGLID